MSPGNNSREEMGPHFLLRDADGLADFVGGAVVVGRRGQRGGGAGQGNGHEWRRRDVLNAVGVREGGGMGWSGGRGGVVHGVEVAAAALGGGG